MKQYKNRAEKLLKEVIKGNDIDFIIISHFLKVEIIILNEHLVIEKLLI